VCSSSQIQGRTAADDHHRCGPQWSADATYGRHGQREWGPSGDIIRGQVVYISDKCIQCHGETGHGIEDAGPGINAEPGNVAADSAWTAGLMGSAVRGNISNRGMALNPSCFNGSARISKRKTSSMPIRG